MPKKKLFQRFPFYILGGLIHFTVEVLMMIRSNVERSIRIQLMLTFAICAVASLIAYAAATNIFGEVAKKTYLDYSNRSNHIQNEADSMARILDNESRSGHRTEGFAQPDTVVKASYAEPFSPAIDNAAHLALGSSDYKSLLIDMNGNVLYKNRNASETHVDLFALFNNLGSDQNRRGEVTAVRPVELAGRQILLITSGYEEPTIVTRKGQSPISLLTALLTFVALFYWMSRKKMRSIEELAAGLVEISRGRLDYRVTQHSKDELGSLANHINQMAEELQRTIEEERRAERTKSELITNVSHDLRTPLTLIMGYLRLLKDRNYEGEEQAAQYLNISYTKSEKLKKLIEDLFDYTKLTNHDVPLRLESVCLNELLEQLSEELVTTAESERLHISRNLTQDRLYVNMDADKMIRVFENLLTNAIKYSLKPGEVRVRMTREGGRALVCVTNRGEPLSKEQLERLFDRFYRIDSSRSSETGGSGLGLAIAKSIVEAHAGRIWAESEYGEIRFWVELPLAL